MSLERPAIAQSIADPVRIALIALVGVPIGTPVAATLARVTQAWSHAQWARLLEMAIAEALVSWLAHRLRDCESGCPSAFYTQLQNAKSAREPWANYVAQLSIDVQRSLQQNGVGARVYKGQALARAIYGDVALRNSGDIDVIVPAGRAAYAVKVLEQMRFSSPYHSGWFNNARFLRLQREATFSSLDGAFNIDLHWRLLNRWNSCPAQEDELFEDSGHSVDLPGGNLPWFKPPLLWRLQLAHIVSADWLGLKTFVDLAHVTDSLAAEALEDAAHVCDALGCIEHFWTAIRVLTDVFGRDLAYLNSSVTPGPSAGSVRAATLCAGRLRNPPNRLSFVDLFRINTSVRLPPAQWYELVSQIWTPASVDFQRAAPDASFGTLAVRMMIRRLRSRLPQR